jgi:Protein of unknown function (DUF1326)
MEAYKHMWRLTIIAGVLTVLVAAPAQASEITGQYVEVRNCDVWTGPCFANAEGNLTGKNAALVWSIKEGMLGDVRLDGLSVVAVVQANETLGVTQTGVGKAVVIVDSRATEAQRAALVKLVKSQAGQLCENVVSVHAAKINVDVCTCTGGACAEVDAGVVKIKTRCLDELHDKHCGNETAYYGPLVEGVRCIPAVAEHRFSGDGLASNWHEVERRGAYVGTFAIR